MGSISWKGWVFQPFLSVVKVVRILIFSMVLIAGAAAIIGFGNSAEGFGKVASTGLLCAAEWVLFIQTL